MRSDADFSAVDGGGFDTMSHSEFTAPAANYKKKHSSVVPVAIKQILDSQDDTLITYKYDASDWSGEIKAILWLEGDNDPKTSNVTENLYVGVTGTLRRNNDAKVIFIYNIKPVESLLELTYHHLQVIYISLKAEEQKQIQVPLDNNTEASSNNGLNLTPQQARVYRAIQNANINAGLDKNEILQRVKIPANEIDKIIEFLIDEDHV